jgi:Tfp pilus assembly protein PilF
MTNDHRMFFPYVGLVLALMTALGLAYERFAAPRLGKNALAAGAALALIVFALEGYGTFQRCKVWDTEESLWKDVTEKSPGNGRGMMNYGLTLMGKGELREALAIYEKAYPLLPNYAYLETNLAIVKSALGMDEQAEKHFRRAVTLIREPVAHPYWARYLVQRGRYFEARAVLLDGLARHQDHWQLRWALLDVLERLGAWGELKHYAQETRQIFPGRTELGRFQNAIGRAEQRRQQLEAAGGLSVLERCELAELRYGFGEAEAALQAATQALSQEQNAWCAHRIAAFANASLARWTESVRHAGVALELPGGDQGERMALEGLRREAQAHVGQPKP